MYFETRKKRGYIFSIIINILGDLNTPAVTAMETTPWLRIYFLTPGIVEKVVIDKGWNTVSCMIYIISVMDGDEKKTLCGTFTKPEKGLFYNETVECGGALGGSVIVELQEQAGCNGYISIFEIKAYSYSKFDVYQFKFKNNYSLCF